MQAEFAKIWRRQEKSDLKEERNLAVIVVFYKRYKGLIGKKKYRYGW
jgi:hypothetical protein